MSRRQISRRRPEDLAGRFMEYKLNYTFLSYECLRAKVFQIPLEVIFVRNKEYKLQQ